MKKGMFRLALVVLTVTAMLLGSVAQGEIAAPEGYPEDYLSLIHICSSVKSVNCCAAEKALACSFSVSMDAEC